MSDHGLTPALLKAFRHTLPAWFRANARPLPWRSGDDPYRVLISEYILQQTRVDQGLPYFERFIERFPDLEALADAERRDVLKVWEGLGYYARARRLHEAAVLIRDRHGGEIPADYAALLELPGVGPYTAAATGSIAFGLPRPAVDGNVTRVFARVFGIREEISRAEVRRAIERHAAALIDPEDPGGWNQAVMELGATICLPAGPNCSACPLADVCEARVGGLTAEIPRRSRRPPVPHHDVGVGILRDGNGRHLLRRRPEEGLLGGLWEFPQERLADGEEPVAAVRRLLRTLIGGGFRIEKELPPLRHAFSHFRVTLHPLLAQTTGDRTTPRMSEGCVWVTADEITDLALPRAHRKLAGRL